MTGTLLGTVLRGMRSRALLTAGSILLTALAVGSAVLGPMFQVASTNSYVVTRLNDAPNPLTGLSWEFRPRAGIGGPQEAIDAAIGAVDRRDSGPFLPPQAQLETPRLAVLGGEGSLLAKQDACEHVLIVKGACPTRPGEALILNHDLAFTHSRLGEALDVTLLPVRPNAKPVATVRIVGVYEPRTDDADYWFDLDRLASEPAFFNELTGARKPYTPAPLIVDQSTFASVPSAQWVVRVDNRLDVPPDWSSSDLAAAVRTAAAMSDATESSDGLSASSINDLASIAKEVRGQEATARSSIAPAVLSLVLVALALLLRLLMAASELRVPELALASLRGLPSRQLWALGLSEPLLVIGLAVPVGAVIGPVLALALVRWWLVPGLPLPWPLTSLLGAVLVVAAAGAVAVLAVGLVLRMSLAGQLTGVRRPTRTTRFALVGQLLLAAVVGSVLAAKLTGGGPAQPDATDLVLPVLLAVAAGLLATRVIAAAAKWWTVRRRTTRSLAAFVAARAISRRHEGTLVILPISAAIAVCVFGAGVYASAADWRGSVAATRAPAAEVLTSSTLPMGQVVGITHDLDPGGQWLMAATTLQTTGPQFVVVDAARLAAVASWPDLWTPGTSSADIASRLSPTATVPSFSGTRVGLTLSQHTGAQLTVAIRLVTSEGAGRSVYLGPFPGPERTLLAEAPYCRAGCRIEGMIIGGTSAQPVEMGGQVRITRMQADGQDIAGSLDGAGWVVSPTSSRSSALKDVRTDGSELVVEVDSGGAAAIAQLTAGGIPRLLPVVEGRDATTGASDSAVTGSEGLDLDLVVTSESTPLLGPVGVMIDYTMLNTDRAVPEQGAATYVFANDGTPESVRRALVERGLSPSVTLAGERRALDQSAYALALRLYAVVAVLVLVMALAGLVVSTAVQLPARRRDAAAMRVVGVRRGTVMSAVAREFLVVLGGAAVAGIAAGSLAQYVVLRTITLGYVEGLSTPRLVAAIDWQQVAIWTAITTVVLGIAAFISAGLTVRGARGSTLRESAR